MTLSDNIKKLINNKLGYEVRTPADCNSLAIDIESKTGEHIGVNTIKRLMGLADDARTTRLSTLDIISRYVGFSNWDELNARTDNSNSDFSSDAEEIIPKQLSSGQEVKFTYKPDREVTIKYINGDSFIVTESKNSKIHKDDVLSVQHIVKGYPLLISDVERNGRHLGKLTVGISSGIITINIL